jgi:hypothetical protein
MTPHQKIALATIFVCVAASALMSIVFVFVVFDCIRKLYREETTPLRKVEMMVLMLSYALFPVVVVISYLWIVEGLNRAMSDGSGLGVDRLDSPLHMILGIQIASFVLLFYLRLRDGELVSAIRVGFAGIIPVVYLALLWKH